MNKSGKLVMHIKVRPWWKWAVIPFVLLGLRVPRCVLRVCFKITGLHFE